MNRKRYREQNNFDIEKNPGMQLIEALDAQGLLNEQNLTICLDAVSALNNTKLVRDYFEDLAVPIVEGKLSGSPFKKADESADGRIRFAFTEQNKPAGLNLEEPHTLIAGSSNSGKTFCHSIITIEALKQNHKTWMFVKSDDVTSIIRIFPDIFYADFNGKLRVNPLYFLNPEVFTSVFNDAFILYEGSEAYLIEAIREIKTKNKNPNLYDLYYFIRARKHPGLSRTARYRESILNRFAGILNSRLGKTFDCIRGHEIDIAKGSAIFNISELTLSEQKFIINSLLLLLYFYNTGKLNETGNS